jgi:GT2 family glycosyltransferase
MAAQVKLTVVIVNYNVRYFLEQCLKSVEQAGQALKETYGNDALEVFVVDNHSVDDSMRMCRELFPWVIRRELTENIGFSRANNLAIEESKAEFVLLLNPDTVVERETFTSTLAFMEANSDCGGLGVRMVDGSGRFLPESKRGLPTPEVAFYKMAGLSKLFPASRRFGKYHLGYLSAHETHEIDVLSGAFMLLRKTTLDQVGLLDETFFMYGEDIDLSYRIQLGGWKNYYFPGTTIIHYKGESTKKRSVNYVVVFYKAMVIFAEKHFSQGNAGLFRLLINAAIVFRAFLALLRRAADQIWLPALDLTVFMGGFISFTQIWAYAVRYADGGQYPDLVNTLVAPAVSLVFVAMLGLNGAYKKPFRWIPWLQGGGYGLLLVLMLYGLLPEDLRFGRALVLLGGGLAFGTLTLLRGILGGFFPNSPLGLVGKKSKQVLLFGSQEEEQRILPLLSASGQKISYAGRLDPTGTTTHLGRLEDAEELIEIKKIDEVIFCAANMEAADIIGKMTAWESKQLEYKIAPPNSAFIIGSQSINSPGEWYLEQISTLANGSVRRRKRLFDIAICFLLPLIWLLIPGRGAKQKWFGYWWKVLSGKMTWVGYAPSHSVEGLPSLAPAVIWPGGSGILPSDEYAKDLNVIYARNHSLSYDWKVFMDAW